MAKRELQFDDGKSRKFWAISLEGTRHTVTFGRIGTKGQTRTKDFDTTDKAKNSYDRLIEQKLAKGYVEAKTATAKKTTLKESVNTWEHPKLGVFTFDGTRWITISSLPAFTAFKYRKRGRQGRPSSIRFSFEAEDVHAVPSKQAVAVALRVVKNQDRLAQQVRKAMWDDLNGQGEDSGMWWHGDRATIEEAISGAFGEREPRPLRRPDDLYHLMGDPSVSIRERIHLYERPCATINFEAAFDEEHGVGVLTDGNRVLGTGYQISVTPFFEEQILKKKR